MSAEVVLLMGVETLPEWLRLLPLGRVDLVDGREPLEVDEAAVAKMVAAFRSRGVDLVIDYEHQSLQGRRAPAAGWIKVLEAREDGLWARVEWTAQAREYLENREYRYFSPVLRLDPETRRPEALLQVALTNVPAIKGLAPVVAKFEGNPEGGKEKTRMWEDLKTRIGLNPEAGEDGLWARVQEFWRDLAQALDLPEDASASQMMGAVAALKAGSGQLGGLQGELAALKARLADEAARQAVEAALEKGKISPAQKTWALEYCRQDPEGFQTYIAKVPQIVPVGTELRGLRDDPGEAALSPEDLAICKQLSLTPAQFKAAQARQN